MVADDPVVHGNLPISVGLRKTILADRIEVKSLGSTRVRP